MFQVSNIVNAKPTTMMTNDSACCAGPTIRPDERVCMSRRTAFHRNGQQETWIAVMTATLNRNGPTQVSRNGKSR